MDVSLCPPTSRQSWDVFEEPSAFTPCKSSFKLAFSAFCLDNSSCKVTLALWTSAICSCNSDCLCWDSESIASVCLCFWANSLKYTFNFPSRLLLCSVPCFKAPFRRSSCCLWLRNSCLNFCWMSFWWAWFSSSAWSVAVAWSGLAPAQPT